MSLTWTREKLEHSVYYRAVAGRTVYSVDHDHRNGRWYAWRRDPGVTTRDANGQTTGSAALGWSTTPAKAKKLAEADAAARTSKRSNPSVDDIRGGAGGDESRWIVYVVSWDNGRVTRYADGYGRKSAASWMQQARRDGHPVVWKVPAIWTRDGLEPATPVHAPPSQKAQKRANPDSPAVARYLRTVRAQQRKATAGVRLAWTTETIGDTPVHSAHLDGVRIRVYAPSRTMGDLYQVYAGRQHYANAHSLRDAKAKGLEAAAYYAGRGPNSMGRTASEHERAQARVNPRSASRSYGPEMLIHAGHAIQQEGANYVVQPYGRAFRSLSRAKGWIDRHVASEMQHPTRNPRGGAKTRVKLTKEQKQALADYNFALSQEDRYLGSVFVTPAGQRRVEEKTAEAYARCKALGMTHEHGL